MALRMTQNGILLAQLTMHPMQHEGRGTSDMHGAREMCNMQNNLHVHKMFAHMIIIIIHHHRGIWICSYISVCITSTSTQTRKPTFLFLINPRTRFIWLMFCQVWAQSGQYCCRPHTVSHSNTCMVVRMNPILEKFFLLIISFCSSSSANQLQSKTEWAKS